MVDELRISRIRSSIDFDDIKIRSLSPRMQEVASLVKLSDSDHLREKDLNQLEKALKKKLKVIKPRQLTHLLKKLNNRYEHVDLADVLLSKGYKPEIRGYSFLKAADKKMKDEKGHYRVPALYDVTCKGITFVGCEFDHIQLQKVEFIDCVFRNGENAVTKFDHSEALNVTFDHCSFLNVVMNDLFFNRSVVKDCVFSRGEITAETKFSYTKFENCGAYELGRKIEGALQDEIGTFSGGKVSDWEG